MKLPNISIGMPVFNGENTITHAIDSLLSQTFDDYELIISDNDSNDNTEKICREYASKDQRIRYIRQPSNIGAAANFKFVFDQAQAEFFMWAACDDMRSPDYLSLNYDFLCRNKDYVASTSPARFADGEFDEIRMGDASLEGEVHQRFIKFFVKTHANSRFYSLMRRDAISKCGFIIESYYAADWSFVLQLASLGKFNKLNEGWVIIGRGGVSSGKNAFRLFRSSLVEYLFPLAKFTLFVRKKIKNFPIKEKISIYIVLLKLNTEASIKNILREFF